MKRINPGSVHKFKKQKSFAVFLLICSIFTSFLGDRSTVHVQAAGLQVNRIYFTDSLTDTGNTVSSLPDAGDLKANVEVINSSNQTQPVTVIMTLYNAAGTIKKVQLKTYSGADAVPANTTLEVSVGFVLSGIQQGDYIKLYVWDSMSTLQPITATTELHMDDGKLLSGNTKGLSIFPESTQLLSTGATYIWNTEGTYATDAAIISTDHDGVADMMDGIASEDSDYSNHTAWTLDPSHGNLIYDLKSVYKVSSVKVWADCSEEGYMNQYEVLASIDGINYNFVGSAENKNLSGSGYALVTCRLSPVVFARYIKVIMHKSQDKHEMRLGEVAVFGDDPGEQSILSNNYLRSSGTYNTSCAKLQTNAIYSWVTEQPFITESDLIVNDTNGTGDGAGGLPDLTDGTDTQTAGDMTTNTAWGAQGKYGTVIFNLNDMYQIGKIDVWTKADSSRYMDGYEVQVGTDGVNYASLGYTENANTRTANAMVDTESYGVPGKSAKYVKIIMHNATDSQQLTLGEIAIWGWKLYDTGQGQNAIPDKVEYRANLKNYSTLYLDWSSYNHVVNNVNRYAVYIETSPFSNAAGKTAKFTAQPDSEQQAGKCLSYFALQPETTYYVAITPITANGEERKDVNALKITTPSVLGDDNKVGNIFAINDFPYGGGSNVPHGDQEQNLIEKLRLLRELGGIHKSRWWEHSLSKEKLYGGYGLNFHLNYSSSYINQDNNQGAWTFAVANEPDLSGTNPASFAALANSYHTTMKTANRKNLLCTPSVSGLEANAAGRELDWMDAFYNSDGQNGALVKTYFDVMDVHPYCKYADPTITGLQPGVPELLIRKIAGLKTVMANHGDSEKPIIFTELGWSTYTGGSYLKAIDEATQRNYLARSYMHSIAGGIKAVHWYAFQDEGTNAANMEHKFGIIDWNALPKKSYYGYYTMIRVLKDAAYLGYVPNIGNPCYGYRFWDENKNKYITALWAADEITRTAVISTSDTYVTVVGIDGSQQRLPVDGGTVHVTISGAPVFIYTKLYATITMIN